MTRPDGSAEAVGLAARILLAYLDGDGGQVQHLVNTNPSAGLALITLAGSLAEQMWGDATRDELTAVAVAADLDGIGREVTG